MSQDAGVTAYVEGVKMGLRFTFALSRHRNITVAAVRDELGDDGFPNQGLCLIIKANFGEDGDQSDSIRHFDNCTFSEGARRYSNAWERIRTHLNEHDSAEAKVSKALRVFGQMLHTVQDFYSHSNWVELHEDRWPLPIWGQMGDSSTLPAAIVSGTYSGEPKRCGHNAPTHDQLAKDSPLEGKGEKTVSDGPNKGTKYYDLAANCAIRQTSDEFKKLYRELEERHLSVNAVKDKLDFPSLTPDMELAWLRFKPDFC